MWSWSVGPVATRPRTSHGQERLVIQFSFKRILQSFIKNYFFNTQLSLNLCTSFSLSKSVEYCFLAPTGAQGVTIFVCLSLVCLKLSIFIFLAQTHFKSTQRASSKHSESNQTASYRRSLKYFVLFLDSTKVWRLREVGQSPSQNTRK